LFIYFLLSVRSHVNAQNHFPRPSSYSEFLLAQCNFIEYFQKVAEERHRNSSKSIIVNHTAHGSIQSREPHTRVMENLFVDDIFLEN